MVNVRVMLAGLAIVVVAVLQTAGVLHAHTHAPGEAGHRHAFIDDGHHFGHAEDLGLTDDGAAHPTAPDGRVTTTIVLAALLGAALVVAVTRSRPAAADPLRSLQRHRRRGPPTGRRLAAVAVLQV